MNSTPGEEMNGWDSMMMKDGEVFSMDDIENMLMMDDVSNLNLDVDFSDDFLLDLLFDSSAEDGKNSGSISEEEREKRDHVAVEAEDPVSKKQRRQLRNRDAALRSRERKKIYVKDLEIKSRYLEGECRRLGILLQCCSAENQALRLSLQNAKAFDASMTKQESAVLVLESLLLGSLLWFLGIVCLFNLPKPQQENVGEKVQGSLVLLERPLNHDKLLSIRMSQLFIMSRRCKGSRSRMKPSSLSLVVLV